MLAPVQKVTIGILVVNAYMDCNLYSNYVDLVPYIGEINQLILVDNFHGGPGDEVQVFFLQVFFGFIFVVY